MGRILLWSGILLLVVIGLAAVVNWAGLDDGVSYLRDMFRFTAAPSTPLDPNGRFGFCHQFVTLRNAPRAAFIQNFLQARNISFQQLPIYETKFNNILVRFSPEGPLTIFSAHYDKAYDEPDYHGASDNSAAVCMLLVAAERLNQQRLSRPVAILFTGEEERGLVGARAFYDYALQNNLQVASVLNFDNIGRDGLAVRASGRRVGYYFDLSLLGAFAYDGRAFHPQQPYQLPDAALVRAMRQVTPITEYDRMIATSDGTYWQEQGWRAVNVSSDNIYFLDLTWHTYRDRIELLDETNLQRALDLVIGLAHQKN